jgi:hypothetical protein
MGRSGPLAVIRGFALQNLWWYFSAVLLKKSFFSVFRFKKVVTMSLYEVGPGFVERFHRTVKEEFFEPALRETFYESVEAPQADLDRWLVHYNTERPHLGYRNMGKRPIDTVNAYLSVTKEAS